MRLRNKFQSYREPTSCFKPSQRCICNIAYYMPLELPYMPEFNKIHKITSSPILKNSNDFFSTQRMYINFNAQFLNTVKDTDILNTHKNISSTFFACQFEREGINELSIFQDLL
jgi:hypothetical protein